MKTNRCYMTHTKCHGDTCRYTKLDNRYSIGLEWCGQETQQYIARFLGKWISRHETRLEAVSAAKRHKSILLDSMGILV